MGIDYCLHPNTYQFPNEIWADLRDVWNKQSIMLAITSAVVGIFAVIGVVATILFFLLVYYLGRVEDSQSPIPE